MKSSYSEHDVTLLLKDISGLIKPLPTKEREALIQKGIHYSEMLPLEYKPSEQYFKTYENALSSFASQTADAVAHISELIYAEKGNDIVLISLARAGIPIGILIKRYLENKYSISITHYAISIIRGRGIDHNAMKYILKHHAPASLQFVDGWIGKGAITKELHEALKDYTEVSSKLAVLADPANITTLCGTHDDILIPSSCLNSTISGLLSRTFLRTDIIGPEDFHGAAFYKELISEDISNDFLDQIESLFNFEIRPTILPLGPLGMTEVTEISNHFNIENINFIKPGIGETTRVLLRRVPWRILIKTGCENDPLLSHVIQLANEKNVPIESFPLNNYKTCGIIKQLADA